MAEDLSPRSATVSTSVEAIRAELAGTKVSTSTLNLIVWIDDPERRDWVLERAAMLAEKHPSLMLVFDHTGVRSGDATVTTGARTADAGYTVRGERIDIDVSGADAATVTGYVAALSRPSVPTLLFDSSGGTRDESVMQLLVGFHREHPEVELRDLAWMRLLPWQDMIADFFDDPGLLEELFTIRALHISSGSDSEAFYLGGWLASLLHWTPVGRDAFTDARGKPVAFRRRRAGDIRRIRSICLDSETSWYHGEVTDEPGTIKLWIEGEHARDPLLYPLAAIDNATLLERAVLEGGPDEVFSMALRTAGALLG